MKSAGRFDRLFASHRTRSPATLVDALSVESTGYSVSGDLYAVLVEFRRLNAKQRLSAARTFINRRVLA